MLRSQSAKKIQNESHQPLPTFFQPTFSHGLVVFLNNVTVCLKNKRAGQTARPSYYFGNLVDAMRLRSPILVFLVNRTGDNKIASFLGNNIDAVKPKTSVSNKLKASTTHMSPAPAPGPAPSPIPTLIVQSSSA